MGIFDFLRARPKNTASVAKERLRIIVAQERAQQGRPDYLPLLRREILEVIKKYVNVDPDAIDIHVEREGDSEILELSVALPERNGPVPAENAGTTAAAGEA
jgi:cell division topological specificity factor